eukprot:scaffold128789_cov31-Tisochrysis_lutea.AAC.3
MAQGAKAPRSGTEDVTNNTCRLSRLDVHGAARATNEIALSVSAWPSKPPSRGMALSQCLMVEEERVNGETDPHPYEPGGSSRTVITAHSV